MVRSINEPDTPSEPTTGADTPAPAPAVYINEDGETVMGEEIVPPTGGLMKEPEPEGVAANVDVDTGTRDGDPVAPQPVTQGALADFITGASKPN